uniref:Uncharacterized protein n=1 Tax=Globodera rostochiensis TaxID=31243 RepID=A0A914I8A9_GLORO
MRTEASGPCGHKALTRIAFSHQNPDGIASRRQQQIPPAQRRPPHHYGICEPRTDIRPGGPDIGRPAASPPATD